MVLIGIAAALLRFRSRTGEVGAGTVRTVAVERREFIRSLRVTGSVQARESRAILTPMLAGSQLGPMVVTKLVPAGAHVKRGQVLVEFDPQYQIKAFLDRQAEYRDFAGQVENKKAANEAAKAKDETELKAAEDEEQRAALENQRDEILSRIDVEKNQEALEEARANLKQLKETFELKRLAAQADIRTLEIQRDRAREATAHAKQNAERMSVRSPMDGVVVLNTVWKMGTMGEVQEGDEVRPGVPIMQVVNPSAMEVRAKVNQVDVLAIQAGQSARVRLDAYPDLVLPATLSQVAPIGIHSEMSDKVHSFIAIFSIQGADPRLMPDLTAAVDVQVQRIPDALVVPKDCLLEDNGRVYAEVKGAFGFEKQEVTIGAQSDMEAVVRSGLRAGDVVERSVEAAASGG